MANDEWQTPLELFDLLNNEFKFTMDVACDIHNILCDEGYYNTEDSLKQDWYYDSKIILSPKHWMNPPYSRGNIDKFCQKAYEESQNGCVVVGLLPLRSAPWFHKYVMKAHEIRFMTRRVKFIDPETGKPSKGSPNFDSIIVVWKPGHVDAPKVSSYEW